MCICFFSQNLTIRCDLLWVTLAYRTKISIINQLALFSVIINP